MTFSTSIRIGVVAVFVMMLTGLNGCANTNQDFTGDISGSHGQNCNGDPWSDDINPPLAPLPKNVVLTQATRCIYDTQGVPGDGVWQVLIEQVTTSGLDELAKALRLPSQPVGRGDLSCPAIAVAPVVITVTDKSGNQYHPKVPQSACGFPLAVVTGVIDGLGWLTTSTTKLEQIQTELSISSMCPDQWKPEIALFGDRQDTARGEVDATPGPLVACRYDLDNDPENTVTDDNGVAHREGRLSQVSYVDDAAGGVFLSAVKFAPLARPCDQPDQPFAVVQQAVNPTSYVSVELGGCYRALVGGDTLLRQLDQQTVDALFS